MEFVFISILNGHIIIGIVILVSYIIEKISNWKLLFDAFLLPKSNRTARAGADFHTLLYFLINLVVHVIELMRFDNVPENYSFWKWLIVMVLLSIGFQKLYFKLTVKNPNRSDFDFSD